jgi:AmmeMemoRadiSam system protein B
VTATAPIRPAAVAGKFYPASPAELTAAIDHFLSANPKLISAFACIVPHAGYVYSGHVAGAVYSAIELTTRCIVLGPNHTGHGEPLAINVHGAWETPLGEVDIDGQLAADLLSAFPLLTEDFAAHQTEHCIEVQLPFLQRCAAIRKMRGFRFVPICIGTSNYNVLAALGVAIAQVIERSGEGILIIASSDMNHYEPDDVTRIKDRKAIDAITGKQNGSEPPPLGERDAARELYETVHREHISMCGYAPSVVMLAACRRLGASRAELIRYATSGDINGDRRMVVGYSGIVIS